MITLEDTFADIIGKAIRGLRLPDAQVAGSAGIELGALEALRAGHWEPVAAAKVAPVLGLGVAALAGIGSGGWSPAAVAIEGLAQFNTPYEDMAVNAYLVWDPATGEAAAFDTGADASGMLSLAAEKQLRITQIFLTHTHGDHIFDLDRLKEKTGARVYVGAREPLDGVESFEAGAAFQIGGLQVATRLTWGHSVGGITYVVTGLAQPLAIVGDAIYAGSMGGGGVSYEAALETNRSQILSLAGETIIAPGHGPLTTVAEQRVSNPFFAA